MEHGFDRGLKPSNGIQFSYDHMVVVPWNGDPRPDPVRIAFRTIEPDFQVVRSVREPLARHIPVDRSPLVDVVRDEVKIPIIVQVDVDGAVGECRLSEPPLCRDILKKQGTAVPIHVVRLTDGWRSVGQFEVRLRQWSSEPPLYVRLRDKIGVIEIVRPAINAIGDEDVRMSVVVEIGAQRGPAPVGRGDTSQHADLAESPLAPVQLQRVAGKLGLVAIGALEIGNFRRLVGEGGLRVFVLLGQHVQRNDVDQPIVVDIDQIVAHGRVAGVADHLAQ